jgi:outer membrane lipoprotein SlyB
VKTHLLAIAAVCALAATGGCSNDTSSSTPALSTTPTTGQVTENFSGTVQPLSYDAHTFTVVSNNAVLSLDMTAAGPPATIAMGLGLGQPVAGTCQLVSGGFGTYQASASPQLSGTIPSGSYCVMVYDVGNQTAPIDYTVVVTHY